jgi:hypothetical protein
MTYQTVSVNQSFLRRVQCLLRLYVYLVKFRRLFADDRF